MRSDRKNFLMKKIACSWSLVVILLFTMIISAGASAEAVLNSTQLDKKSATRSRKLKIIATIKKGETKGSLLIEISLKNISRKEISFRDTSVLNDYSLVVRDREGNIMPLSKEGRRKVVESRLISYKPPVILHPGEQLMRDLVITEIYDFRPGNAYTITVYRRISLDKGKTFEEARANIAKAKVGE